MRKCHNLGWVEELDDRIVLGLFRWSEDKTTLSVTKEFRDRNAINNFNTIHKWMDRLYWLLDDQANRLRGELSVKSTPTFIRKQGSLGASADPTAKYLSTMTWACRVKQKKLGG